MLPRDFDAPARGRCALCGDDRAQVVRFRAELRGSDGLPGVYQVGMCDLCAHALRHHWQKALGERVSAVTPTVSRTYVVVPRLPKGREELDVGSYEILTGPDGQVPSVPYARDVRALAESLGALRVETWPETMRRFYVGYDGSGDFSEVYEAWAWGKTIGAQPVSGTWRSFASLLEDVTPQAGFLLAVKSAFENILWRREVAPEGHHVAVAVREPAMRYLRYHLADDPESLGEDESMLAYCQDTMSPEEREVLALVGAARDREKKEAEETLMKGEGPGPLAPDEESSGDQEEEPPPGFARTGGLPVED